MSRLLRTTAVAIAVGLVALFFSPLAADAQGRASTTAGGHTADLLSAIPVTGTVGGQPLTGTLTITHLEAAGDHLVAEGVLEYTAMGQTGTQAFSDVPLMLDRGGPHGNNTACRILDLDLGPLHLDLLGLVVDLNEINLDITAVSGPGNLLGNLLCAVAGLLDGPGLGAAIQNLLDTINEILSGLLGGL